MESSFYDQDMLMHSIVVCKSMKILRDELPPDVFETLISAYYAFLHNRLTSPEFVRAHKIPVPEKAAPALETLRKSLLILAETDIALKRTAAPRWLTTGDIRGIIVLRAAQKNCVIENGVAELVDYALRRFLLQFLYSELPRDYEEDGFVRLRKNPISLQMPALRSILQRRAEQGGPNVLPIERDIARRTLEQMQSRDAKNCELAMFQVAQSQSNTSDKCETNSKTDADST